MSFKDELDQAIEWNKVLEQIGQKAAFTPARSELLKALPLTNPLELSARLSQSRQAALYLEREKDLTLHENTEIPALFSRLSKGAVLEPMELLEISQFLKDCNTMQNAFGTQLLVDEYDSLLLLVQNIDYPAALARSLEKAILSNGEISQDASPALKELTIRKSDLQAARREKARAFAAANSSYLMDSTISYPSNRAAFLVKAVNKNKIAGLVHGQSNSGEAYYIEPSSFISINNELANIDSQIREEEIRICKELSIKISKNLKSLRQNVKSLSLLDQAFAKARWMKEIEGSIPVFDQPGKMISITQAKHPLLDKESAIKNDYRLKPGKKSMVLTGPNMGGKSVALKTFALCEVLAASGFPVPAESMKTPLFTGFYFDISEQQSIENHLSTFSAHMNKMAKILKKANENSLVVVDEIGSGTDPSQGAALAQAIMETLISKKVTSLISTHYEPIKAFAKTNPSILACSMEFDLEKRKPTYRLLEEQTGASFAFYIAQDCKIPSEILKRARSLQKSSQDELDAKIEQLNREQKKLQSQKDEMAKRIKHLHTLQKEAETIKKEARKEKEELETSYNEKLSELLEEKRNEIKEIRDSIILEKTSRKSIDQALSKLSQLEPQFIEREVSEEEREAFEVGDYVKIPALGSHGEIVGISKKKATIDVNGKKISISFDQLEKLVKPKPISGTISKPRTFKAFPSELNIVGMRVDEGRRALDHYLDQAVLHRLKMVRIIHGLGSGKLRAAIWKDLSKSQYVKRYESAGPGQGGLGATVVELGL